MSFYPWAPTRGCDGIAEVASDEWRVASDPSNARDKCPSRNALLRTNRSGQAGQANRNGAKERRRVQKAVVARVGWDEHEER
jgi:hypothetical protein